jgi:MFS family permease
VLEALTLVLRESHGFSNADIGYAFTGPMLASCIGVATGPIQERLYRRARDRNNGVPVQEARLYLSLLGTTLFTAGLFIFAWTSSPSQHWIGPVIGASITVFGCYHIYHATFSYLADAYQTHASSCNAGQSFLRNLVGAFFPLFTNKLFHALGFQWAGSLIGFCAAAISVLPFLLFVYGKRIRARSKLSIHD